jgi:hypothetical protein
MLSKILASDPLFSRFHLLRTGLDQALKRAMAGTGTLSEYLARSATSGN